MIVVQTEMDKMPACCDDCGYCRTWGKIVEPRLFCGADPGNGGLLDKIDTETERPEWCPLREV